MLSGRHALKGAIRRIICEVFESKGLSIDLLSQAFKDCYYDVVGYLGVDGSDGGTERQHQTDH